MLAKLRTHLTYANVISTLCLFIVLGGTSYAAVSALKRNSVKAKHIAGNAVGSSEVRNGALRAGDFAAGELPQGERGREGPRGQDGQDGQDGARGPSNAYARALNLTGAISITDDEFTVTTLTLPAGSYVLTATGTVSGTATCRIRNQGTEIAKGAISHLTGSQNDVMTLSGVATTSTGGVATFTCQGNGMGIGATTFRAVQVETLTMETG